MEKLTPAIIVILDGVEGIDRIPANLATISVFGGKSRFYNFCQKYIELNKVFTHLISQICLGAAIEAVAFDFDFTSYSVVHTIPELCWCLAGMCSRGGWGCATGASRGTTCSSTPGPGTTVRQNSH